ncbi:MULTISPECIES: DUF4148 domain-containing protein [unclassified Burkholderia]|uniref:DUF4148 domain-containing protein n=1 Tax=unclassified Burkholderia TaxID=2613784 RepID=UPI001E3585E6|nr:MULTISPECIES: DUF4148 domain-containing protein [unclassified Burkholderia]UEP32764.1 DUF4148 domain-containing protein [Burkholderia sp. B21-007]UEP46175.1 DUF4148 domain-containing protein [Burkholderia sp. B21-005]
MRTTIAAILCFVTCFPLAASAGVVDAGCAAAVVTSGKTRAEVRAELVQAERDGWIPIHSRRQRTYPPDMAQARRNWDVRDAGAGATPSLQASNQQP